MAATKARTHKEIADIFNVRARAVTSLTSALKRSKSTIVKRRTKELTRSLNHEAIIAVVRRMINEKQSIWYVKMIQDLVKQESNRDVTPHMVRHVLKTKFKLSYKKIRRTPFAGNLERNKVLRSLYAQKMLSVYQSGKRVINVDESWIPHADFRQKRWSRRGLRSTAPDKALSRKINVITAMSSDGEVWMALTTCNTDTSVLMLFMTHLAKALTKESADWRHNTVFLLDGVSARANPVTMKYSFIGILPQV